MKKNKQQNHCVSIGGQAVIEGVMMRGQRSVATAVRDPKGNVQVESEYVETSPKMQKVSRIPFVRGVVNFARSLSEGNRILMRSADVAVTEDEVPTKAEKWLKEKHKIDLGGLLDGFAVFLGVLLALGIFIALPQFLMSVMTFLPFKKESVGLDDDLALLATATGQCAHAHHHGQAQHNRQNLFHKYALLFILIYKVYSPSYAHLPDLSSVFVCFSHFYV